ncbi:MAG: carboxypeptidase-like regulatory domain-containing protein [Cyclobacteriaceae bacterium]|nr:carboxypeptidase-like regulatory domain-containing protein [Cyclobacteriaceae bacterium]
MNWAGKIFLLLSIGLYGITITCFSQTVQGKVVDERSGEPLPFVNISLVGTTQGTVTDINGRYVLSIQPANSIRISYVGYTTTVLSAEEFLKTYQLIKLKEAPLQLESVVILAGENPAHKIIRKVTANRKINDPENLVSFQYKAYHKFYATLAGENQNDTSQLVTFLKNSHFFVSETVTERKYVKPNLNKETITGNRMSGVKDPFFAVLASDFQPFTFYKDHITLLEKDFLNPISPGSIGRYDYQLEDTLLRGADTTFVISFEPLPGRSFESLKGQLYINTNGYAIENVLAQPADDHALINIQIEQQYAFVHGHWFPRQLNTEFFLTEYKIKNRNVKYAHSSYITDITIGAEISKNNFGLLTTDFAPGANKQHEPFWQQQRQDTLERKEQNTYKFYDSLGNKLRFMNSTMSLMEGLATGKLKWGRFYLPVEHLLRVNKYEGLRVGFGLQTGETISRIFQWDGYVAYGFNDQALKYGGGMQINLSKKKDLFLSASYQRDVREPGNTNFIKPPPVTIGNQSYRNYLTTRMDSLEQYKIYFHARPLRFIQVALFAQQQNIKPAYAYAFSTIGEQPTDFTNFETGFQLRYAFREGYVQVGQSAVVTTVAYPQVNFSISKSFSETLNGAFDFIKSELAIDHQFRTKGFGQTTWKLSTGLLHGDAPYSLLFNGRGSNTDSFLNNLIVPNYFQTMGLYEFVSDRYMYLFLSHNFGRLTGTRSKNFRPELSILHNMGVGSLSTPSSHQEIIFNTMEKGYIESGAALNNIFRFKYVNLFYWGFGAGAFYRYGPYSFSETRKNFAVKLSVTFSL